MDKEIDQILKRGKKNLHNLTYRPFVAITNELPEDAKKYEHQINHDANYDLPGYTSKSNQRLYVEIAPKRYYMIDIIDSSAKVPGFLCSHLSKEKLIPIKF